MRRLRPGKGLTACDPSCPQKSALQQFIGQAQDLRGDLIPVFLQNPVVKGVSQRHQHHAHNAHQDADHHGEVSQCSADIRQTYAHAGAQDQRTDDTHRQGCRLGLLCGNGMKSAQLLHFILFPGKILFANFFHFLLLLGRVSKAEFFFIVHFGFS